MGQFQSFFLTFTKTRPRGLTDAINETWGESLIMKIFLRSVGSI